MKVIARFEIPYYQFLNEESQIVDDLPDFAKNPDYLVRLYRCLVLNRIFDTKAITLQRTGKMGTYPSTRGQEAVFVGIGDALAKEDLFVPYYRDVASLVQRGVKMSEILLYWGGDERGNNFFCGGDDFPYSVPISSQTLHAVGAATAIKIRGEKRAVLSSLGDGGTSEGDFYEAMNVAGIWKLPIVFIINNNQWAISMSRNAQTATQTLAQKAVAAGFSGEQVDGNDVIAVRQRVAIALKKARDKQEPTLIETLDYRHADHTTADDANRYEPKGIREAEWKKEPIARLRHYLESIHAWTQEQEEKCVADCTAEIEQTVKEYLDISPMPPESMFDYLYASLPKIYEEQREVLKNIGAIHG